MIRCLLLAPFAEQTEPPIYKNLSRPRYVFLPAAYLDLGNTTDDAIRFRHLELPIVLGIYKGGGHSPQQLDDLLKDIKRLTDGPNAKPVDIARFSYALSIDPDKTEPEYEQAFLSGAHAAALEPGNLEYWSLMGRGFYRKGDLDGSMRCWQEIFKQDTAPPETFLFAAMCHHKLNKPEVALELFAVADEYLKTDKAPRREARRLLLEARQVLSEPATVQDMSPTSPPENDPPANPANVSD